MSKNNTNNNAASRLRAINSGPNPRNTINTTGGREREDADSEPAAKRRKHDDGPSHSPYFPNSKPGTGAHLLSQPENRSKANAGRGVTGRAMVPELRQTQELFQPKKRRRRRSEGRGSHQDMGQSTSSRSSTPTEVTNFVSIPQSPIRRMSPDELNEPPPANIVSDILGSPRKKVSQEERYRKKRVLSDRRAVEISDDDELAVKHKNTMPKKGERTTNFTNVSSRQNQHVQSRGDIVPTNFKTAKPLNSTEKVHVRRAASGRFFLKENERVPGISLHLGSDEVANVKLEHNRGSFGHLNWMNIVKLKIRRVDASATHSPIVVIKRARTEEAPDDLCLELSTLQDAMKLVKWLDHGLEFREVATDRLSNIFERKFEEARTYSASRAVVDGPATERSDIDRKPDMDCKPWQAGSDPFKGEGRPSHGQRVQERMREPPISDIGRVTDSGTTGAAKEKEPDYVRIIRPAREGREGREGRERTIRKSSSFRDLRSPSPERWTSQNRDWHKRWHRSLVFPATGRNRATVDKGDILRLDEGEFLNDNLINFYFRYLQSTLEAERPDILKKVYFFSTFFFEKLRSKGKIVYDGVKSWTSKIDLFSYDYVVVPVNEHAHWYLAIICNAPQLLGVTTNQSDGDVSNEADVVSVDHEATNSPKVSPVAKSLAIVSLDDEVVKPIPEAPFSEVISAPSTIATTAPAEKTVERLLKTQSRRSIGGAAQKFDPKAPGIITLDSLGSTHAPTCKSLKEYLVEEAKHKKNIDLVEPPGGMTARNIPEQNNHCDCGVFILGYMEEFLKDPDEAARKLLQKEETNWSIDPSKIRNDIRSLLFKLQKEQQERLDDEAKQKRKKIAANRAARLAASGPAEATMPSRATTSSPSRWSPPCPRSTPSPAAPETPLVKTVDSGGSPPEELKTPTITAKSPPTSSTIPIHETKSGSEEHPESTSGDAEAPNFLSPLPDTSSSTGSVQQEVYHSARTSPPKSPITKTDDEISLQPDVVIPPSLMDKQENILSFVPRLSSSPRPSSFASPRRDSTSGSDSPDLPRANGIKRPPSQTESPRPRKSAALGTMRTIEIDASSNKATYDGIDQQAIDLTGS